MELTEKKKTELNRQKDISCQAILPSTPRERERERVIMGKDKVESYVQHELVAFVFIAEVMLWRRKKVTLGILFVALAAWVVFEGSGYTLLSLVSSVLLLLAIVFLWTKSAEILNRPPPSLPNLHISQEVVNEVATDSKMFLKIAAFLWLISVVGSWIDFLTFGCTFNCIKLLLLSFFFFFLVLKWLLISYSEF
ncbi:hypothetical protein NE237_004219 [Protea cynaroides]|uniref:Reticulon-like protein n=1 Tax=Protea cynaroides TaxID=273540 RepID=A0A9Q0KIJ5_9MAGN|nr:hypothetical protein NE237_004219 [Protea cynaroides]